MAVTKQWANGRTAPPRRLQTAREDRRPPRRYATASAAVPPVYAGLTPVPRYAVSAGTRAAGTLHGATRAPTYKPHLAPGRAGVGGPVAYCGLGTAPRGPMRVRGCTCPEEAKWHSISVYSHNQQPPTVRGHWVGGSSCPLRFPFPYNRAVRVWFRLRYV